MLLSESLVTRSQPTESGNERDTLTQVLDFLRATVVMKATGVSDEQAESRSVPASDLTIAGLVKHLTGVERFWFSIDFAAHDLEEPWTQDDPHGNFRIGPAETIDGLIASYVDECERSRGAIAGASLSDTARAEGMDFNLRYALTHMVEETARHCGHLDLLREQIDGTTGA